MFKINDAVIITDLFQNRPQRLIKNKVYKVTKIYGDSFKIKGVEWITFNPKGFKCVGRFIKNHLIISV